MLIEMNFGNSQFRFEGRILEPQDSRVENCLMDQPIK